MKNKEKERKEREKLHKHATHACQLMRWDRKHSNTSGSV
jgi:hypothetical protein